MEHQESKSPIVLKNTQESKDGRDIVFNQHSTVRLAPAFDIDFEYSTSLTSSSSMTMPQTNATVVSFEEVPRLEANQRVNVTAILSKGTEKPNQVQLRATQKKAFVKEDCIIEDTTGSAMLHIWEPMSEQLKSGTTYEFKNFVVKNFQGTNHLSTSTSTSFSVVDQQVEALKGPSLLECAEKNLKVKEFKSVNKLDIYISCENCKRKVTELSEKYAKCHICGIRQRIENCTTDGSVQLLVDLPEDKEIWLTVFTDILETLLMKGNLALTSDSDSIEEYLLALATIVLKILLQIFHVRYEYNVWMNIGNICLNIAIVKVALILINVRLIFYSY